MADFQSNECITIDSIYGYTIDTIYALNSVQVQSMDDNCGEWVECMGVASGCGEQDLGVASGSG